MEIYLSYSNLIESPTSSSNGFLKNIITVKKFKQINKNILSIQAKAGNIISLNNNDILTDDKFSLGGRWLRGFDLMVQAQEIHEIHMLAVIT